MNKIEQLNNDMKRMYEQFEMLMGEVRAFQMSIEKELPKIQKREMKRIKKKLDVGKQNIESKNITPVSFFYLAHKGIQELTQVGSYSHLSLNSSFLMLMTNFEYLVKHILKYLVLMYPELIIDKKIQITIQDIERCKNIENVKKLLTQTYLNKFLFQDFNEQLQVIFKFLQISKKGLNIDFDLLERANKIRNLLVHNRGIITDDSLEFLFDVKKEFVGKIYVISAKRLHQINEEILAFGIVLIFSLASRIGAKQFLNDGLTNILFDLLCHKYFSATEKIYSSIDHVMPLLDGPTTIASKINYCIALRHLPEKKSTLNKTLTNLKYGHFDPRYEAAICVLKNDKKKFVEVFPNSDIKLDDWINWPLFEPWRKDRKLFNQIKHILKKNTEQETEKQRKEFQKNFKKLKKKNAKK